MELVTTELIGIIIRGKYTLVINWVLSIRLLLDSDTEEAKNCQGSIAEYTMIAYGTFPSLGSFASLPKITVKTIIVRSGLKIAHITPIAVCL